MAQDLSDVGHWFGGDLLLSPTGDLSPVTRLDRSRQRVLRRLMTAEGEYITHPEYGSGLPERVGDNVNLGEITGIIKSQMAQEASVDQTSAPVVKVSSIANGVLAAISYITAPEQIPAILSFDASAPQ